MSRFTARARHALALCALLFALSPLARGQETAGQYDRGTPPQHAAGVNPFGSYASADLGTVNLSNGSLNFKIPLGQVGGRGFLLPLSLNYSSKVWSASTGTEYVNDPTPRQYKTSFAVYDADESAPGLYERLAPGWSLGAVPELRARGVGLSPSNNSQCGREDFFKALTKLTVMLPDKGEVELRDDYTDGSPLGTTGSPCRDMDGYRGQRWHSTDGSGTVFISDAQNGVVNGNLSGWLVTSDGTRYRFDDTSSGFAGSVFLNEIARAGSVTDRNGNRVLISYSTNPLRVTFTDQLGRETKVEYGVTDPQTGETLAALVTLPGYQGQARQYKLKAGVMNQNYRPGIAPALPVYNGWVPGVSGDENCGTEPSGATLLFASWCGGAERLDDKQVLTELVLPDERSLRFRYNEYGEVAEVEMPAGGKVQYDYAYEDGLPAGYSPAFEVNASPGPGNVYAIDRAVKARRTYPDGVSVEGNWSYEYTSTRGTDGAAASGLTEVIARAADNATVLSRSRHYFMDAGRFLTSTGGTGYSLWSTGLERRTETLNAAGTAILAAGEEDWAQRTAVSWSFGYASQQVANDNRVNESRKYLDDGKVARTAYLYGPFNNPTEVSEFDYDGALERRTTTSYLGTNPVNGTDYTGDSIRLLRLPLQQSVFDGAGVEQARTVYEYDDYAADGNNYTLTVYPTSPTPVTGHDTANYGAGRAARGNATRVGRWLKEENTYLDTYTRFDMLGNVVSVKDARGFVSTISYADDFGGGANPGGGAAGANGRTYALPTLITSPPPNPGEQPHTARSQYDFSTGLLTGFKDRNGVVTQTVYDDPFDRPTLVKSALGVAGVESHAAMYYAPATAFGVTLSGADVMTVRDQNALDDAALRSWTRADGFGRAVLSETLDPQGDVFTKTVYDGLGRARFLTNPYRSQAAATDGWTRTSYDAAGRVTEVATFGGPPGTRPPDTGTNASWTGSVVTSYAGNEVTATDQAGKKRKSVSDALGRMVKVYEDPDGSNYLTSYDYDPLGNLLTVTQGVQTRSFVYDSLSRLTTATNPEDGTAHYKYDAGGNLTLRIDPRQRPGTITLPNCSTPYTDGQIATCYEYDALNRIKSRSYNDGTPNVTYVYDASGANSTGRLSSVSNSVSTYSYTAYDEMGRVKGSSQTTGGVTYSMPEYRYNLAGGLTSEKYPSGKVVETKYDAAGLIAGVKKQGGLYYAGGDPAVPNNPDVIKYAAHGAVTAMKLGNGLWEHGNFNSNLQVTQIGLGTATTDSSKLRLDYTYGTDDAHNNGNARTQSIKVPGLTQPYVQTYAYDALNRLSSVEETNSAIGAAATWKQVYSYDRYGNRALAAGTTYPAQLNDANNPQVGSANNRIVSAEYSYDGAGNLLCDSGHRCVQGGSSLTPYYEYDAENHMKAAGAASADGGTAYLYDGNGRRVKKVGGAVTTVYVYDAAGQLLAEYGGEVPQTGGLSYITQDAQGSARVITGQSQNEERGRYDYLPFGEEVYVGRQDYGGNNDVRQRFIGKERDAETGLDYFGARYYAASAGRFTGVDPSRVSVKLPDPQSWNRYTYALNNPLKYLDTNGKWLTRTHEWIVDHALPKLSSHERGIIKAVSKSVDHESGSFSNENAYKHGLRKSDETFAQAADKTDKWITDHISAAGNASDRDESLKQFGYAFHTVTDETSPSHIGYQIWRGMLDDGGAIAYPSWAIHALGEVGMDAFHMGFAIAATQKLYLETYKQGAFFAATGDPNVLGTPSDPAVQELERTIRAQFEALVRPDHNGPAVNVGSLEMEINEAIYNYNLGVSAGWTFDYHRQSNLGSVSALQNQQRSH